MWREAPRSERADVSLSHKGALYHNGYFGHSLGLIIFIVPTNAIIMNLYYLFTLRSVQINFSILFSCLLFFFLYFKRFHFNNIKCSNILHKRRRSVKCCWQNERRKVRICELRYKLANTRIILILLLLCCCFF